MHENCPFLEKMAIFCINWPNLRKLPVRLSQICPYWYIARWYKNDMGRFLNFLIFFLFYRTLKSNFLQFWTKFEISDRHKIKKKKFKNSPITFLYHLDIYLNEQILLNLTGSFLKFGQFMLKMAIFSIKGNFPCIS